jgi:hypothetical protein
MILPHTQSEEVRDVILETTLPALDEAVDVFEAVQVTVTYRNFITKQDCSHEQIVSVRRSSATEQEPRNLKVDQQYNRWLAAQAMEQANKQAAQNQLEAARLTVERASERIKQSPSALDALSAALMNDLSKCKEVGTTLTTVLFVLCL